MELGQHLPPQLRCAGAPAVERLARRSVGLESHEQCWIFCGRANRHGYGRLRDDAGRTVYVHRLSFLRFRGPVGGFDVHHVCGERLCWNPAHLELVPPDEHRMYEGWIR